MTGCVEQQSSWEKCLTKANRNSSKCVKFETDLRKCSVATREDFCIDETVNLMNCTKHAADDRTLCANEFINFRECRRPFGRQLVQADHASSSGFAVVEAAKSLYLPEGAQVLMTPAPSSPVNLKTAVQEYARNLGLTNGTADLRF